MSEVVAVATVGDDIDRMLSELVGPALAEQSARLGGVARLSGTERQAIHAGLARDLRSLVWRQVSRVVVLELHVAKRGGRLTAGDPAGRWQQWVAALSEPGAWDLLARPYPALLPRVHALIANRCAAATALARRFAADRAALAGMPWGDLGELVEVEFGAGDSHQRGQTVARLRGGAGALVYKPRSVSVDAQLGQLLPRLLPGEPATSRIRVPAVLPRADKTGDYGWAEYVAHRYCDDEAELTTYYRGLGHWLAVLRLVSGSDLHAQNLIAAGPVPVVVDCETMFTPPSADRASGYGDAADLAVERLEQSVLRSGLLPGRGTALGYRGRDLSAAGSLPGQQPVASVPALVELGTDQARYELAPPPALAAPGRHLPSPAPELGRYWEQVVTGYTDLTQAMRERDRAGELAPLLAGFAGCPVRVVLRSTSTYAELAKMLWHPSSLHEPEPARQRAAALLARQAEHALGAPDDPAVIDAEVAELCDGDVPVFVTTPGDGRLTGPRGTTWGAAEDLIEAALARWRRADVATDRRIVRATLLSAYLNDEESRASPPGRPVITGAGSPREWERSRRRVAAEVIRQLADEAVRGEDGTVTWVAPALDATGWSVRVVPPDLYSGVLGVAVALAGYRLEQAAGRANEVPGLSDLLDGAVATLHRYDEQQAASQEQALAEGIPIRPDQPGGYLGLGARIAGWLLLHRLGAVDATRARQRAEVLAGRLPAAVGADDQYDLLAGMAGAVVPLLRLAEHTGAPRWRELAHQIGHQLATHAQRDHRGARWNGRDLPAGLGGFAHGATGMGWALARLAEAVPDGGDHQRLAEAAFRWQESLYHSEQGSWRDQWITEAVVMRGWCHGAVGIGVAASDLLATVGEQGASGCGRDVLARAWQAIERASLSGNHTLCHGDPGAWELACRAAAAGCAPPGAPARLAEQVVADLAARGPVTGQARNVFRPGLMLGVGGVAYQLLRMHPESRLPSVLLPDPGPPG